VRRQWRADYVSDPIGEEAQNHARSYFAGIFPADWDGRYDVERYPSYGPDWQDSGRASVPRLKELAVYELANRQDRTARFDHWRCIGVGISSIGERAATPHWRFRLWRIDVECLGSTRRTSPIPVRSRAKIPTLGFEKALVF
jgi:hypothetical protein